MWYRRATDRPPAAGGRVPTALLLINYIIYGQLCVTAGVDTALLRDRTAAPAPWLAARLTGLAGRPRLVEACRAELVWARADWLEIGGRRGLAHRSWDEVLLAHEQAAARLLAVW